MSNAALPQIEIFRAGSHTAVDGRVINVSHADLAAIADAYDPAVGEAPHVIGHPQLDAPAFGWVSKLEARDGVLFAAQSEQLDPAFTDLVKNGRFKKRSASFFLANSPGNPKPAGMYLRHVGWLGAAAPAVTGLRDVQFAADAEGVVEFATSAASPWVFRSISDIFRRLRERIVEKEGMEQADIAIPSWSIDSIAEVAMQNEAASPSFAAPAATTPEPSMQQQQNVADFAARDTALNTRQADIEAREARLKKAEDDARRVGIADFAAGLVKAGRLLPRQQAPIVELLVSLESGTGAGAPATLNFAAADGSAVSVTAGAALRTLLGELPVQVHFDEHGNAEAADTAADFAAPLNTQVDRTRLELHGKAQGYMRQHPKTKFLDAVRAVGG